MKAQAYRLMEDLEQSHWWYKARNQIVCRVVSRLAKPGADCLDYGCGTGGIATKLGTLGFNVLAADVSDNALNACRNAGLAVLDLREEWPDPQSADVVLACDV